MELLCTLAILSTGASERLIFIVSVLFGRTNTLLDKLVLYTVSTGGITALFAVGILIAVVKSNAPAMAMLGVSYLGGEYFLNLLVSLTNWSPSISSCDACEVGTHPYDCCWLALTQFDFRTP